MRDVAIEGEATISPVGTGAETGTTPGHTAGTVSLIVSVTVHGEPHELALRDGAERASDKDLLQGRLASLDAFDERAGRAGADEELSRHPFADDGDECMETLRTMSDAPTPPVIDTEARGRCRGVPRACAMAELVGG